jgi:hypothetical protein
MSDQPIPAESGGDIDSELDELRRRVAAQDRLIEAMLAENVQIHHLRNRNHELEQYVGRMLAVPGVRGALSVRRRLLGRPS